MTKTTLRSKAGLPDLHLFRRVRLRHCSLRPPLRRRTISPSLRTCRLRACVNRCQQTHTQQQPPSNPKDCSHDGYDSARHILEQEVIQRELVAMYSAEFKCSVRQSHFESWPSGSQNKVEVR